MTNILEFKDLYRTLGNRNSFIKVSGSIPPGGILALKGPSGAGKSTVLRMLARLIAPESGEMYLKGQPWLSLPPGLWRRRVQYLSQKPVMFAGTVEDNLRMSFTLSSLKEQNNYSQHTARNLMETLDLPLELLPQNAQTLSGGEASRVALIRALLVEPEVLLLDEPTAYLDETSRFRVLQLISEWVKQRSDRGVIIVSHTPDDLGHLGDITAVEVGDHREVTGHE
ncbi:MAG: ATP-binding cassette domain-containing protein [Candidatus Saccharibacteria bacterium]